MTEEVGEIMRVLQLVTYDEDEWSGDNLQVRIRNRMFLLGEPDPTVAFGSRSGFESVRPQEVFFKHNFIYLKNIYLIDRYRYLPL